MLSLEFHSIIFKDTISIQLLQLGTLLQYPTKSESQKNHPLYLAKYRSLLLDSSANLCQIAYCSRQTKTSDICINERSTKSWLQNTSNKLLPPFLPVMIASKAVVLFPTTSQLTVAHMLRGLIALSPFPSKLLNSKQCTHVPHYANISSIYICLI